MVGFFKKLNTELPYDPAIPLLSVYPEEAIIEKDTCTPVFTEALERWDGVGGGREVQEGGDICTPVADSC